MGWFSLYRPEVGLGYKPQRKTCDPNVNNYSQRMLDQGRFELATELLKLISWDDLRSLTRTVTDGLIVPSDSHDAIKAILQHSTSLDELLTRQKVTKEVLFTYLHSKDMKCGQKDKQTLKQMVLELWKEMVPVSYQAVPKALCPPGNIASTTVLAVPAQNTALTNVTSVHASGSREQNFDSTLANTSSVNTNELALRFTEWFYSLLNQSDFRSEGCQIIGPEHFFQDCSIHMCLESRSGYVNNDVENDASGVARLLVNTKSEHNLYFNPNTTTDGVRGKMDRHGLVLVAACGTLHQGQNCAGVFDQLFALARDPFADNNWKIKYTEINLKSQELVSGCPSLEDGNTGRRLLSLPDLES